MLNIVQELTRERDRMSAELARINTALLALTGSSTGKRRGRPPKNLTTPPPAPTPEARAMIAFAAGHLRRPFSKATRRKMAAAQKKRWAAYKTARAANPAS